MPNFGILPVDRGLLVVIIALLYYLFGDYQSLVFLILQNYPFNAAEIQRRSDFHWASSHRLVIFPSAIDRKSGNDAFPST